MRRSAKILKHVKEEVERIVERFNKEHLSGQGRAYVARFRGNYLYFDRSDFGNVGRYAVSNTPAKWMIGSLSYTKSPGMHISSDEFFFPGEENLDGAIEGAMKCGLEAYD